MAVVTVKENVEIFYTDDGSGPPVLLLHGWSCDGHDWNWLGADLAADHRVIVVDHRGHGRSSVPAGPYGAKVMAQDAAAVLSELGVDRALVVGHSMGTVVACVLAAEYPGLVSALVLIDAVPPPALAGIRAQPVEVALQVFSALYVESTPAWLPFWHARRLQGTAPDVISEALCQVYDGLEDVEPTIVGKAYRAARNCPVLAVYSRIGAAAAQWDASLPHGPHDKIVVWDEAGHFLHQEQPERFAALVRAWLGDLPSR